MKPVAGANLQQADAVQTRSESYAPNPPVCAFRLGVFVYPQSFSVCILPYYEWSELHTPEEKQRYLWAFGRRAAIELKTAAISQDDDTREGAEVEVRMFLDTPSTPEVCPPSSVVEGDSRVPLWKPEHLTL